MNHVKDRVKDHVNHVCKRRRRSVIGKLSRLGVFASRFCVDIATWQIVAFLRQ
jgi:hypothetical protein